MTGQPPVGLIEKKMKNMNYLPSAVFIAESLMGPIGYLQAQLVEHCTAIAEVMGANPVQA